MVDDRKHNRTCVSTDAHRHSSTNTPRHTPSYKYRMYLLRFLILMLAKTDANVLHEQKKIMCSA